MIAVMMAAVSCPCAVHAQSDMIPTQHWALPTLFNPACAGETDMLRLRGLGRLQWLGIKGAPECFAATADLPFNLHGKRVGAGMTIVREDLGLFSNLLAGVQASPQFRLGKGMLGAGIQVSYSGSRFRASDIYIPDGDDYHNPDDPSAPDSDISGSAVDVSLGMSYVLPRFHAGISVTHITSPKIRMETKGSETSSAQRYEIGFKPTLYFETGGNIELKNTLFILQPSLITATDGDDFSGVVSVRTLYNRFLSLGVGYRWKDALSVMVGAEFKNFFIGYSFDHPLTEIARSSSGSHEIVAGYSIKLDIGGKKRHRHRSIRIM